MNPFQEIKGVYFRQSDELRYTIATDVFGAITSVTIKYGGNRYVNPTIIINGTGSGAVLTPEVSNTGTIASIFVTSGGSGYGSDTTLTLVEQDSKNVRILPSSTTIGRSSWNQDFKSWIKVY